MIKYHGFSDAKGGEEKMRILIIVIFTLTVSALTPSLVSAQSMQQQEQDRVEDPAIQEAEIAPQGNQVSNQNQIQTQNQGEDQQIMVATEQMQQLVDMEGLDEEVGEKVKKIAQQQVQAQNQIEVQVEKLQSKSGILKMLFGPDYDAIQSLKQQMQQNQQRIQQLQTLANEVKNEEDQIQVEKAISTLVEENTVLQDKIKTEENINSIFGWLIRLFQ